MRDVRPFLVAALLAVPIACSHEERDPQSPRAPEGAAGSENGPAPAPTTTMEPVVPGVPNAKNDPNGLMHANQALAKRDGSLTLDANAPAALADWSQPVGGSGGTIGAGGTGATGLGGFGTGGTIGGSIATGGSIVH